MGITYILERLNLSGKTGLTYSAKVSKKGFGLISEENPSTRVSSSNSSNTSEVISMLTYLLFATNLAFFCSIYSRLSTRPTSLAHYNIEV